MKKALLALALTALTGTAAAVDFGIYGGRNAGSEQNFAGFSVGQKYGRIGLQATADRSTTQVTDLNRYTASVSYDLVKIGAVQTNVRAGVAYLDPQATRSTNGGAGFAGVGISYPVTKKVSAVVDYAYQKGNNITKAYDGNIISGGFKYSF